MDSECNGSDESEWALMRTSELILTSHRGEYQGPAAAEAFAGGDRRQGVAKRWTLRSVVGQIAEKRRRMKMLLPQRRLLLRLDLPQGEHDYI
jgi:hypothetical protein